MASAMLWAVGAMLIGASPFVTHANGEGAARWFRLVFAVIGALCWRVA